jgi:hypothetical protein
MTSEMQRAEQNGPFQRMMQTVTGGNAGAISIESERAIAEARGQMQLAKMFPRDLNAAYAEMMDACKLTALAKVAFYSVPQGGSKVTGPSIRLAEEIARIYGNFEFGHRELSRVDATADTFGKSEIEVYAWDKEKNNRSIRQITVLHVLDTKDGPRKLRDQKDIDNKIANVASKQARGRILALMPKWLVEAAQEECRKTLAGDNSEPLAVRVRRMTQAFAPFGVTTTHLEAYLGCKLDDVLADQLVDLTGVFNAIREGTAPSEFFGENSAGDNTGADLTNQAKAALAAATQAPAAAAAPARAARAPKATQAATPAAAAESQPAETTTKADPAPKDPPPAEQPKQEAPAAAAAAAAPADVF